MFRRTFYMPLPRHASVMTIFTEPSLSLHVSHRDRCIYASYQRDQSSGTAGRVNPAPGRQLRCFAEGHFNRHDHICYVHIVRPIWFFFAPIYSGLEPCQSYWMLENINEKRANPFCAATHLLPVFTHLAFSKCLSFMFTQARPRCLGNNLLRHMM